MPKAKTTPTMGPPEERTGTGVTGVGTTEPRAPTERQLAASVGSVAADQRPMQLPPAGLDDATGVTAAAAVGTTWRSGATVTALWCINELRNAWMLVPGIGWRKLYNGSDGAFTALLSLASQARQTGRTANFREEGDGMVHEIYLW